MEAASNKVEAMVALKVDTEVVAAMVVVEEAMEARPKAAMEAERTIQLAVAVVVDLQVVGDMAG